MLYISSRYKRQLIRILGPFGIQLFPFESFEYGYGGGLDTGHYVDMMPRPVSHDSMVRSRLKILKAEVLSGTQPLGLLNVGDLSDGLRSGP